LVKNSDFAQDCLQDFFIDLWNRRENLEEPQSIKAYLVASYRRRLFKEKERSFWHKRVTDLEDEYDVEVQFNIESYLINNETEHETLLKLKHHLESLSKRQREALYLRFYQELEYDEISQIMAINHHSAINLVYESLKLLRKNWVVSLLFFLNTIL
jgi:RNA polymerase sigma factor (sigma-70 family)